MTFAGLCQITVFGLFSPFKICFYICLKWTELGFFVLFQWATERKLVLDYHNGFVLWERPWKSFQVKMMDQTLGRWIWIYFFTTFFLCLIIAIVWLFVVFRCWNHCSMFPPEVGTVNFSCVGKASKDIPILLLLAYTSWMAMATFWSLKSPESFLRWPHRAAVPREKATLSLQYRYTYRRTYANKWSVRPCRT